MVEQKQKSVCDLSKEEEEQSVNITNCYTWSDVRRYRHK